LAAKARKLLIIAMLFVYWLAVSASMYVYYSPVGFKIIVGLQGRYFLPAASLLIPLFYGGALRIKDSVYHKLAIGLPLFLLAASTITIYVRYYISNV
jgi:uncharacterized membrane protein